MYGILHITELHTDSNHVLHYLLSLQSYTRVSVYNIGQFAGRLKLTKAILLEC